jgi:hypothetical protein
MARFGAKALTVVLVLLIGRLLRASPRLARVAPTPAALADPSPVSLLASGLTSQGDARDGAALLKPMAIRPVPNGAPAEALSARRAGPLASFCAPECEANGGNCDRRSGRCDCPPMRAGDACDRSAVPMCAEQWGLVLPVPPCQALIDEPSDWREFPPTCE